MYSVWIIKLLNSLSEANPSFEILLFDIRNSAVRCPVFDVGRLTFHAIAWFDVQTFHCSEHRIVGWVEIREVFVGFRSFTRHTEVKTVHSLRCGTRIETQRTCLGRSSFGLIFLDGTDPNELNVPNEPNHPNPSIKHRLVIRWQIFYTYSEKIEFGN